jgi:hypothetical protein
VTDLAGEREIERLRKELAELRAEVEELKAEAEPPPDPPPKWPFRLIQGGGIGAAGIWFGRHWRQEIATVTASATTIAVLVWRPDTSPNDLQAPPRPPTPSPSMITTFDPSVPASPTRTPSSSPTRTAPSASSRPAPTMRTEPASPTPRPGRRTTTPTVTPTPILPTPVLPTILTRTLLPRTLLPRPTTPLIQPSSPVCIEPIGVTICVPPPMHHQ